MLLNDGTEPAAVLGGAYAEGFDERAAHGLGRSVAAGAGDLLDAPAGVLQVAARGLDADPVHVLAGGDPGLGGERAGEVAR